MAERTGRIREYHAANRQGIITPDDKGPEVRFYRAVVTDQSVEPRAGYLVSFEAPPVRLNKKRRPVQDAATAVTITDTSHPVDERTLDGNKLKKGSLRHEQGRRLSRDGNLRPPWRGSRERKVGGADGGGTPKNIEIQNRKEASSMAGQGKELTSAGKVGRKLASAKRRLKVSHVPREKKSDAIFRRYLRPLPVDIRNIISELSACTVSPALLLDKYLRSIPPSAGVMSPEQKLIKNLPEQARLSFLKDSFIAAYNLCWQNRTAWLGIRRRHSALLVAMRKAGYGIILRIMQSTRPFGMLSMHPTMLGNVGIELHKTYGYPIVPSRQLRSLMRAYALAHPELANPLFEERLKKIFGLDGETGELIVLDAIPAKPPRLEAQDESAAEEKIYRFGSDQMGVPCESLSAGCSWPRLRIKKGATFVFALALRPGVEGSCLDYVDKLCQAVLTEKGFVLRRDREGKSGEMPALEAEPPP